MSKDRKTTAENEAVNEEAASPEKESPTGTASESPTAKKESKSEENTTPEEKLAAELNASKEQYLRLAAEYDNYRKRSAKERENIFNDAKASVFTELLPVLDNFERAFAAEDTSLEDFKKGIEMTHGQLLEVLKKFGIESFGDVNDKFDPNFHNAVMHIDDEGFEENVLAEVFQKGYKVGDKVLRPAMVKVAN